MAKEKKTDILVARLLTEAGIDFTPEESSIAEINEALKTASKRDTGRKGFPEFVAQSGDFIIVIEDKTDAEHQAKYMNGKNDTLLMDTKSKVSFVELVPTKVVSGKLLFKPLRSNKIVKSPTDFPSQLGFSLLVCYQMAESRALLPK